MAIQIPKEVIEYPPGTLGHLARRVDSLLSTVEAADKLAEQIADAEPRDAETVTAPDRLDNGTVTAGLLALAQRVTRADANLRSAIDRISSIVSR